MTDATVGLYPVNPASTTALRASDYMSSNLPSFTVYRGPSSNSFSIPGVSSQPSRQSASSGGKPVRSKRSRSSPGSWRSFSELPGDRHGVSANARHERDGTDDPIRELRLAATCQNPPTGRFRAWRSCLCDENGSTPVCPVCSDPFVKRLQLTASYPCAVHSVEVQPEGI